MQLSMVLSHLQIETLHKEVTEMAIQFQGGCLCGSVRYECTAEPVISGHCQCTDCRKASGSGHSSHLAVPVNSVSISGNVKVYDRKADSGNMVGRAFCPSCGSPVYSVNCGMPGLLFLRASSLDDLEMFKPQVVVFTKRAASWDYIDPKLPAFEAMPPSQAMPAAISR